MNSVIMSAAIVGVLFIIFYIPFLLAKGVSQMAYGKKLEMGILLRCWIPIYNVFYADQTYFGGIKFASGGLVAMLVTTVLRVVQWYFMYDNEILARVCIVMFCFGIGYWYASNCFTSFIIMKESGAVGIGKSILYSIIFPFGYFYIGQFIVNVVSHKMSERSDRSWDDEDEDEL